MPTMRLTPSLATVLLALSANSYGGTTAPVHTPTSGAKCASLSHNKETGDTQIRCPGVAGMSLLISNSDDRASISLLTTEKATVPLNFWDVVTPTFSTLGPRVEWHMASIDGKSVPVAIIVRVDTVDQTDVSAPQPRSYQVVAQLRKDRMCVVGKIPFREPHSMKMARALATASDSKCLPQIR
jgi:hypothetical protein